ncbi:MAG: uracil-DNA glycosylase family protein [Saprospiraceae bacterium]
MNTLLSIDGNTAFNHKFDWPFVFQKFELLQVTFTSMNELISDHILSYHFDLEQSISTIKLPKLVEWLLPYSGNETQRIMTLFYKKYYHDQSPRTLIFGINPGRLGGGLTGIPFTDPVKLIEECQIENSFPKKPELSAQFIYQVIHQWGGLDRFYSQFYISSLCPLGFIKEGVNYNYYDDKILTNSVTPFIVQNIIAQKKIGRSDSKVAYCLGEGKNFDFFNRLNAEHHFFDKIIPLPHPRWIMQYRRKSINQFLDLYIERLGN